MYIYFMENGKPLNGDVIARHVEHLRKLDGEGKLVLCGPFSDYPGGMVVLRVQSFAEATEIAEQDPFIAEGYKTYGVRTLEVANRENNYLL